MKKHFKAIELKHLDDETVMKIREWRNSDFVRKMVYEQDIISEETHRAYINKLKRDNNRGLFVFYLDEEPFGVYQYILHENEGYVENGNYLIKQEYQDLGYGMLLSYFEMEIVFNVFNYPKSYGEIFEFNRKLISMNKKMGAHLEQILYKHKELEGRFYDVYQYTSYADEWENNKQKYEKIIYLFIDDFDLDKDVIY